LEQLINDGRVKLIIPRTVIDEFARNKSRVIESNMKSLSSTFKRAKDLISKFGNQDEKQYVLPHLNDVDQRKPYWEEASSEAVSRIEKLFAVTEVIEISDAVKVRAAQRAIDKRAPFHRQRNGIDDSILIEVYSDVVKTTNKSRTYFAFITHNTNDFSYPNSNNKLPHPDIADVFSQTRSFYFISLGDALHKIDPGAIKMLLVSF
jgi:hypothetical protein